MLSTPRLLLIGLLAFVAGLVLQLPAASAYGWLHGQLASQQISLRGIDGTAVDGRAAQLAWRDRALLNDVDWRLAPLQLLLGRIAVDLHAGAAPVRGQARLAASPSRIRVSALKANGSVRDIAGAAGLAFVPFDGDLTAHFSRLVGSRTQLLEAEGELQLMGLRWTLTPDAIAMGDYRAEVRTQDSDITVAISTLRGQLDVSGQARLGNDGQYQANLQIRPRPGAPPGLKALLGGLGRPDAQGYYRIKRSGRLSPMAGGAA